MTNRVLNVLLGTILIIAPAAIAKDHGKGKGHGRGGAEVVVFRDYDRRAIVDYYRAAPPPGLPPGLAKKVRRGGTLPPGWQKKMVVFPLELERQLVPLPVGYRRAMIGGQAVIYDAGTSRVIDVFVAF